MKTLRSAIILSAFALLSTGAFASSNNIAKTDTVNNEVSATVNYASNICSVDLNIEKADQGDDEITIYDANGAVVLTDKFTVDTDKVQKSYMVDNLADGDYTIAVRSDVEVVKRVITLSSAKSDAAYYAF